MSDEAHGPEATADLKALLEQVQILSNQIKKSVCAVDDRQQPLAVGRAVLETLETGGPQTVPAIAEQRNSSRQNVQIVVNRLRRLGFVEFVSNPAHRRSGLIRITDEGIRILRNGVSEESRLLEELRQQVAGIDLEPTVRLLAELRQALAARELPTRPQSRVRASTPASDKQTVEEVAEPEDYSLPYNLL